MVLWYDNKLQENLCATHSLPIVCSILLNCIFLLFDQIIILILLGTSCANLKM